jgi:hypothetical protein
MGSVALALRGTGDWDVVHGPLQEAADAELTVSRLVSFLDAGFRAPVVEAPSSGVGQVSSAVGQEK